MVQEPKVELLVLLSSPEYRKSISLVVAELPGYAL
jgi:hypothetical protein